MKKTIKTSNEDHQSRQIIGFSLPPDLAAEVKMEAARRNISLRNLFTEMWVVYKNNKSK